MTSRPRLRELSARLGIEDGYESALDGAWVPTPDTTREALVAAMGFEAGSEQEAERALSHLAEEPKPADPPATRCFDVDEKLGARAVFGLWTNLYSVRSTRSLGFGHVGDLAELARRAASEGAAFIGLNPLHATTHRAGRFCPYDPVSRVFRDPLYIDAARVPELDFCAETRRVLGSARFRTRLSSLRQAARIDVARVEDSLYELLRPLHATFHGREGDRADARRRAFERYRAERGEHLTGFARFLALADHFEAAGAGRDWHTWPEPYRDPSSEAVRSFARAHDRVVDFHEWVQFELDRQLGEVAREASDAGLSIGLCTDLALGSSGGGSDTWCRRELFARGASVGAPPDAFSREGQNWCFPPLHPRALRGAGGDFWSLLIEANLRHAGALRLDHALGLRRLFWIPDGATPREGAYVRQPEAELTARLAEASRRRRALIVGEDLGTVPRGFSEEIQERGLLSTRVLLFERDGDGFRPAGRYPAACLATANTHDLPPLAALSGESDLELRRRVGQIPDDAALEILRSERRDDQGALAKRLMRDGLLGPDDLSSEALAAAVTGFLDGTPARLLGIALDDLAGEDEPINLPGVAADRHPSWTRRMRIPVDAILTTKRARRMLSAVGPQRRPHAVGQTTASN